MRLRAPEMAEMIIGNVRGYLNDALLFLASPPDIAGAKCRIHGALEKLNDLQDEVRHMDIAMETLQEKVKEVADEPR